MQQRSRQRQPPKMTSEAATVPAYEIVGLQRLDTMPIEFNGRTYDLASLSDEDAAYLLQFPEQVPYLRALDSKV